MRSSNRHRASLLAACGFGVGFGGTVLDCKLLFAQQNPYDQVVFHTASNDSNGTVTSFNNTAGGTNDNWAASVGTYSSTPYTNVATLAAGSAPTAGYAYVVTGSSNGTGEMRTPNNNGTISFAGDSLTLIPYDGQQNLYNSSTSGANQVDQTAGLFIKSLVGTSITVNNLILANGGVIDNFNNTTATLNGNIFLVPSSTNTLDGISLLPTATAGQGIIDTRTNAGPLTINSNISGGGMLHILQSGGTLFGSVALTAANTYTGGTMIDNTVPYGSSTTAGSGNYPLVDINNPSALGTGLLTIQSVGTGPTLDSTVSGGTVLATGNAMAWNGSFQFLGSNNLDLGNGAVTLNANVTITTNASTLSVDGPISDPVSNIAYGLSKAGLGTLALNGPGNFTGTTGVSAGTLLLGALGSTGSGSVSVTGGTLAGLGTVQGPLTLSGGFLAPGSTLPGELTLDSTLLLAAGSTLDILLTASGSDELLVDGQTTLGGSLVLSVAPGYTPKPGTTFTLIDDTSSLATIGTFSDDLGGYVQDTSGNFYDISYTSKVDGDGVANDVVLTAVASVPEPVSAASIAFAAIELISRRRARSA